MSASSENTNNQEVQPFELSQSLPLRSLCDRVQTHTLVPRDNSLRRRTAPLWSFIGHGQQLTSSYTSAQLSINRCVGESMNCQCPCPFIVPEN